MTTEYANASTSETVHDAPGAIKRLTVSAFVDLSAVTADASEGAADAAKASDLLVEKLQAIIEGAVGFDASRNDKITVMEATLNRLVIEPEVPGFMPLYEEYRPLIEAVLVGLGATIAFFMAVLALRKLRPVLRTGSSNSRLQPRRLRAHGCPLTAGSRKSRCRRPYPVHLARRETRKRIT